jgi:hypothetical protein
MPGYQADDPAFFKTIKTNDYTGKSYFYTPNSGL